MNDSPVRTALGGSSRPTISRVEARRLGAADLGDLHNLHQKIVYCAPAGTVARETTEFLVSHLGSVGHTVGLFVERRLIAYGILGLSGPAHARLGSLLHLDDTELERLAVLDGVGVAPAFRGRGLHRELNQLRAAIAARHGRSALAATAAPANSVSWRNLMQFGLEIRGLARMFGGCWRYLMLRDGSRRRADAPVEFVRALDITSQQRLLAGGYRGRLTNGRRVPALVGYLAEKAVHPSDPP